MLRCELETLSPTCTGVAQHVLDTSSGMSRVHGKECRTCLGNGPHRQNGLDGAWETQRHHRFGTHSGFDQHAGQSVRLRVEFEIGHFTFLEHQRNGAGILGGRHICCCSQQIRKGLNSGGNLTSHGYQFG